MFDAIAAKKPASISWGSLALAPGQKEIGASFVLFVGCIFAIALLM